MTIQIDMYRVRKFISKLKEKISSALHHKEIQMILVLFVISRIFLTLIGIISDHELSQAPGRIHTAKESPMIALDVWGTWDSGWYLGISQHGYNPRRSTSELTYGQASYAFFPLYPLLMRAGGWVLGGNNYLAGLLISNLALFFSLYYLYKLTKIYFGEETAWQSARFLLLFPTAFILSGAFTESLFLALTLASFYYARQGRWWLVGLLGGLSALTRSLGVLLILPMVWEYFKQRKAGARCTWCRGPIWLVLIPFGLFLFVWYNFRLTGDWLAFAHIQSAWGRQLMNPAGLLHLYEKIRAMNTENLISLSASALGLVFLGWSYLRMKQAVPLIIDRKSVV